MFRLGFKVISMDAAARKSEENAEPSEPVAAEHVPEQPSALTVDEGSEEEVDPAAVDKPVD